MENTATIHEFNKINNEISALYHEASVRMHLADSEMQILYILCDEGDGITQKHIIDVTGMSKQTVNSAVRKMEMKGILRLGDPKGRRREISLTSAGRQLVDEKIAPFMELEESIFRTWTEEERRMYIELNRRYAESLGEIVSKL